MTAARAMVIFPLLCCGNLAKVGSTRSGTEFRDPTPIDEKLSGSSSGAPSESSAPKGLFQDDRRTAESASDDDSIVIISVCSSLGGFVVLALLIGIVYMRKRRQRKRAADGEEDAKSRLITSPSQSEQVEATPGVKKSAADKIAANSNIPIEFAAFAYVSEMADKKGKGTASSQSLRDRRSLSNRSTERSDFVASVPPSISTTPVDVMMAEYGMKQGESEAAVDPKSKESAMKFHSPH